MFLSNLYQEWYKNTFEEEPSYEFCKKLPKFLYPFYLKRIYQYRTGRTLNLKNPKTYCEKIQWLKLYDSNSTKTELADKIKVRKYVAEKIGEKYLKKIYGIWDDIDEIDFNTLPPYFVLKTNHSCGTNYIVKKSILTDDIRKEIREKYKKSMAEDFSFVAGFEMHYTNIERKIFAEEFINNVKQEYEVLCFNGKPKYICLADFTGQEVKCGWFDKDFKLQPFYVKGKKKIEAPEIDYNIASEIWECSEKICPNQKLVRCDFMISNQKIYFGELTFTPLSGFRHFEPIEYETILGDMIDIQ